MSDILSTSGFSIGAVLSSALRVWRRNAIAYTLVTLPVAALNLLPLTDYYVPLPDGYLALVWYSMVESFLLSLVWMLPGAIITHQAIRSLRREDTSLLTSARAAMGLLPTLLLATIVVDGLAAIATFPFVFPQLIVAVLFWVVMPVIIEEGGGVVYALHRSLVLTKGIRWPLFGLLVLLLVLSIIFFWALELLPHELPDVVVLRIEVAMTTAGSLFWMPFLTVVAAVTYAARWLETQGPDIDTVSSVFD